MIGSGSPVPACLGSAALLKMNKPEYAKNGYTMPAALPASVSGTAIAVSDARKGTKAMNWDDVKGNWKRLTGKVKQKWGKLTDDDLIVIAGKRQQVAGKLQERHGYAKERADKELDEFTQTLRA
jgi:uncharacterized protein YjbJ (UPF0337 family)